MPAQIIDYIDPPGPWGDDRALDDRVEEVSDGRTASVTTFFSDGSIVVDPERGAAVTITFLPDGSIQQVYGAPVNQTWITSFGADGSISRELDE